jgi:hypothetical protein
MFFVPCAMTIAGEKFWVPAMAKALRSLLAMFPTRYWIAQRNAFDGWRLEIVGSFLLLSRFCLLTSLPVVDDDALDIQHDGIYAVSPHHIYPCLLLFAEIYLLWAGGLGYANKIPIQQRLKQQ